MTTEGFNLRWHYKLPMDLHSLLDEALKLKRLKRSGWVQRGLLDPESVAAHSWGVAWLAVILCPPQLDRLKVLEMAIIHDLAEVRVGDITPRDGVSSERKQKLEREAIDELLSGLADAPAVLSLWEEFELGESAEARFTRVLDKLDMGLQALHYQVAEEGDVQGILDSALKSVSGSGFEYLLEGEEE
uniref:5'-deoxynucleotidase n=1 Tax=uncultured marine group II/III euryarchaeote KM3_80_G12 TaxID=1456515 RepID=A0A075HW70_9EURY|nr:hypothetical protein [uncultured marine group II/III euryarchaeote KM3_80_G12]